MSVVFRPAQEENLDALAGIRAREWETEAYWKMRIGSYMAVEQSPQQALPPRAVFVAVDDGQVVGFVAGHRTRRYGCDAELQWIDVVPERRGRGIAGQLLAVMAAWFVEQGAFRVCVDAEPGNSVARGLYARYGAERLNDHWMQKKFADTAPLKSWRKRSNPVPVFIDVDGRQAPHRVKPVPPSRITPLCSCRSKCHRPPARNSSACSP